MMEIQTLPSKMESPGKNFAYDQSTAVLIPPPRAAARLPYAQQLLAARRQMTRAVTCTTRPPRKGEQDGVDYFFLDADSFLKRVQAGNFLEHATVYGNSYGTLKGKSWANCGRARMLLLNVDVQGAATIGSGPKKTPN